MPRTRLLLPLLLAGLCVLGPRCSDPTGPEDITEYKSVTIRYERALPIPDPGAVGQPVLSWLYYHGGEVQQGDSAMTSIEENTFSVEVGIRTETQVALHVIDPQYPDWVCRRLFLEALDVARQEIAAGALYGQVAFILRNDGRVVTVDTPAGLF